MSEYWVSHKKYYCTYCKIYIADDAPSRQQHENGLRHKGNRERYIRGLYKTSEKRKNDLEEEKREIARIDQAAQAAFAQDIGSGVATVASSSRTTPSTSTIAAKPVVAPKPSSPWSNYSTAASLGYTDPDLERMNAEVERRRTQGVAGEWEMVSDPTPPVKGLDVGPTSSRKQEADIQEEDEEDGRRFKLRKKTTSIGLGEVWDSEVIPIKLKVKKGEEPVHEEAEKSKDIDQKTAQLKWTSRGWKRPGESDEPVADNGVTLPPPVSPQAVTEELPVIPAAVKVDVEESSMKTEELATTITDGGGMFRKRKFGGGNRAKR